VIANLRLVHCMESDLDRIVRIAPRKPTRAIIHDATTALWHTSVEGVGCVEVMAELMSQGES